MRTSIISCKYTLLYTGDLRIMAEIGRIKHFMYIILERLLFIFLLVSLLASSVTIAKAAAIETTIDYTFTVSSGQSQMLDLKELDFAVSEVKLLTDVHTNGILSVSKIEGRPIDKFLISRLAYEYFRFDSSEEYAKGSLYFDVDHSFINGNNLDKEAISLYQFDTNAGKWQEVETHFRFSKGSTSYYVADVEDFGYYVISDKDIPKEIVPESIESMDTMSDTDMSFDEYNSNIPSSTPDLELPSQETMSFPWLTMVLIVVIVGAFGTGSFILVKGLKKNDSKKMTTDAVSAAIAAAEHRALEQIAGENDIKSKIAHLEPKVAQKFVLTMRSQGIDDDTIRAELLQHRISYSVIQKVMG